MTPVQPSPNQDVTRKPAIAARVRLEAGTLAGLLLAFGSVYAALILQGGTPQDLLQWSSAILLLGGTCGAVLITTPLGTVWDAVHSLRFIFIAETGDAAASLAMLSALARKVKRSGLISLEQDAEAIRIPFLHRAIRLAADGLSTPEVMHTMRLEIQLTSRRLARQAQVFETAGGYAPTLGILGAVVGLIQVMKHLDEIATVGHGIAEAFVSTIYGLAFANLILLPIAGRLRSVSAKWVETHELLADGMLCLIEKIHPMAIEARLAPYVANIAREPDGTGAGDRPRISLAKGA